MIALCGGTCGGVRVEHEVKCDPSIQIDLRRIEHTPRELQIERTVVLQNKKVATHTPNQRQATRQTQLSPTTKQTTTGKERTPTEWGTQVSIVFACTQNMHERDIEK